MGLTQRQKRVLKRIADGAKIQCYLGEGGICFKSDEDGLRAVLYTTLTLGSLLNKGLIVARTGRDVSLTVAGYIIMHRTN